MKKIKSKILDMVSYVSVEIIYTIFGLILLCFTQMLCPYGLSFFFTKTSHCHSRCKFFSVIKASKLVQLYQLAMAPLLNKYYRNGVTLSGDKMP